MPDTADPLKRYYAERAPYYDDVYARPERRADIAFLRAFLAEAFAGRRVLEVACGTGYWTQVIAPVAAAMTAIDALEETLQLARARPGTGNVRFARADAYALPASLGSHDGAFAGLWLSHVPIGRRREFLAGLHARLGPGARVVFIDNSKAQWRDFPVAERDAEGNTYQLRRLKDGSQHRVLKNFPAPGELDAMVAEFGTPGSWRELENFWLYSYAPRDP